MTIQNTPLSGLPYPELEDTADVPRDVEALAEKLDGAIIPVGGIIMWFATALPSDAWRFCDGSALDPDDFVALGLVIPEAAGVITLPDLRGRVPLGAGSIPLSNPAKTAALKSTGGQGTYRLKARESALVGHSHGKGTLAMDQRGGHSHGGATQGANRDHSHNFTRGNTVLLNVGTGTIIAVESAAGHAEGTSGHSVNHEHGINAEANHAHVISGAPAAVADDPAPGARDEHLNLQPYLAVNYIIRVL